MLWCATHWQCRFGGQHVSWLRARRRNDDSQLYNNKTNKWIILKRETGHRSLRRRCYEFASCPGSKFSLHGFAPETLDIYVTLKKQNKKRTKKRGHPLTVRGMSQHATSVKIYIFAWLHGSEEAKSQHTGGCYQVYRVLTSHGIGIDVSRSVFYSRTRYVAYARAALGKSF